MVGVLRFRNSETGEWQEINAIKGEPGKDYVLTEADKEEIAQNVGTDNFYTKSEIDNKLDEMNAPNFDDYYKKSEVYNKDEVDEKLKDVDVDLSDYYTKDEVDTKFDEFKGGYDPDNNSIILTEEETLEVNPEWINGKLPRYGRGLAYDGAVVRMNSDGTIGYDANNRAVVNQNNIFVKGGVNWVLSQNIDPFPLNSDFNLIEFEANLDDWFANLQNENIVRIRLRTAEMGFGGGTKATIERGIEVRGVLYDYYINLIGTLSPALMEQLGINGLAVGYNSGFVSFIIRRNPAVELDDIVMVELGDEFSVSSLAHYWIGRNRQWKVNGDNLEISEDYINELIDIKLDEIPNAEGVEV